MNLPILFNSNLKTTTLTLPLRALLKRHHTLTRCLSVNLNNFVASRQNFSKNDTAATMSNTRLFIKYNSLLQTSANQPNFYR
jgi:hypothetical protein